MWSLWMAGISCLWIIVNAFLADRGTSGKSHQYFRRYTTVLAFLGRSKWAAEWSLSLPLVQL